MCFKILSFLICFGENKNGVKNGFIGFKFWTFFTFVR